MTLTLALACSTTRGATAPVAPASDPAQPPPDRLEAYAGLVLHRACSPSGPELCFNARDDNCNGLLDEGCGLSTGTVQFMIAWDEPTADVDLVVTDPNGERVEVGRVTRSSLILERDCPGEEGACQGQNVENVFQAGHDAPTRGLYRVALRLDSFGEGVPPLRVVLGVRLGGKTYAAEVELTQLGEERVLSVEL